MSRRIFITGYGIITSIGNNADENYQSLINRKCGFGGLEILDTIHKQDLPACEIKLSDDQLCEIAGVSLKQGYTRTTLLGIIAAKEAMRMASLTPAEIRTAGLLSATTTGGIRELERHYYPLQDPFQHGDFEVFTDTANPGEHSERMAEEFGMKRYIATVSTACSSSANTIMLGARLIRNGELETAICGGTEALSKFTINGFNSLMILDKEHCRPFDISRKGLNLGEGGAYLVLQSEDMVQRSGKTPLAELTGYGNTNDAFHQTASSPDGAGAFLAMNMALNTASLVASEISYINTHGTATENNDLSEGLAIQKLFGDRVPPFSSTKPYTGHTLAAAGSIEAVFSILAIRHAVIFPNINFNIPMDELSITPEKELIEGRPLKNVLSNSFGFGGNVSSLLFSAV
ncbi:MAG: beta-ketoacyl-[acyl-carrier-protein] synthase family protein [Chitinophagaceae bacterium]|nr:beta-ketoacyl-[acyl-carrier-protein] synthase family protein [Chitinophagaceae bacterium]